MTRQEYIAIMVANLSDLPAEERDAAIEYYDSYIADAGEENEQDVINHLGSPQKLAAEIKKETVKNPAIDFDTNNAPKAPVPPAYTQTRTYQKIEAGEPLKAIRSSNSTMLFIILAVLLFPVWFPLIVSFFSVAFSITLVLFLLGIGFTVAGVGLFVSGIILVVANIVLTVTTNVLSGVFGLFLSLVACGMGLLLFALGMLFFGKVVPAIVKGISALVRWVFSRKREVFA